MGPYCSLTIDDGWLLSVAPFMGLQTGVRNQHRLRDSIAESSNIEIEIKRNKAHGGCLGIERR